MPEGLARGHDVADESLERGDLGEAAVGAPVPHEGVVDPHLEDTAAAGDERKAKQAEAQAKQWEEWLKTAQSAVDR